MKEYVKVSVICKINAGERGGPGRRTRRTSERVVDARGMKMLIIQTCANRALWT